MTIVEIVDAHQGFKLVTDSINTTDSKVLLWILATITFFMSSILDNLTTTIVMVSLLRKLVPDPEQRRCAASLWLYLAGPPGLGAPSFYFREEQISSLLSFRLAPDLTKSFSSISFYIRSLLVSYNQHDCATADSMELWSSLRPTPAVPGPPSATSRRPCCGSAGRLPPLQQ
jgi:hypothetical protein